MRQANKNKWEDYLYDEEEEEVRMYAKRRRHTMQAAHAAASLAATAMSMGNRKGRKPGAKTKKRVRLDVDRLFQTMDDQHFRRKYRMEAKPAQPAEHPQAEDDFQGDGTHVSQLHRCWL
mmetsp:Transcript_4703/g.7112  ORF Transcript_4703/g.7112 Transcript_4703/m.7112 type:complete len:119 (-) Transcript_4703:173-529(-)